MEKKKNPAAYIALYALMALVGFATYYFTLPAINLQSSDFWLFAAWLALLAVAPFYLLDSGITKKLKRFVVGVNAGAKKNEENREQPAGNKKAPSLLLIPLIPLVVLAIGTVISLEVFNAANYAEVIDVTEADFVSDMPQTDKVTHIALMDTDTAKILAVR